MQRGDLVRLEGLETRDDLNGSHGLVVGSADANTGRWPVCILGTASPIVGVNVMDKHMVREDDAPGCVRVQAWNDLGVAYSTDKMYEKSLRALFDAMLEAQKYEGAVGVRQETCRSLSNIAWLCLVMNKNGVDINDDGTFPVTGGVRGTMEWAMRAMFSSVIHDLPKDANLLFGAGRLPNDTDTTMHLIMTVVETENATPRYFVVDEDGFRVYEYGVSGEKEEE